MPTTTRTRKTATSRKAAAAQPAKGKGRVNPVSRKAAGAKATAKAAPKTSKPKVERVARGRTAADQAALATIVKRHVQGGESLSAVARDLHMTPGKAAWMLMLAKVDSGEVSRLTFKEGNESAMIKAERTKGGEYAAWHWIAARSGLSESRVKAIAKRDGYFDSIPNVAVARAAAKPKVAPKAKTGKAASTKGTAAKAKRTRKVADPS